MFYNYTKKNQAYERVFDSTSTNFEAMVYVSIFNLCDAPHSNYGACDL